MLHFHNTDRPSSLYQHEGLTQYLNTAIAKPVMAEAAELTAMSPAQRADYDRQRIVYLSGGIVLKTHYLDEAKRLLAQAFAENIGRNSGHAGLVLSGASTLGKTTIAKALMKYVFNQYRRQFPDFHEHGRVPVVYVEVPAASTGKLLMKTFADFFGLHVKSGESMGSIRARIVDFVNAAGTQLIVVDELQNLAGRGTGNGESVDLLKNLHNDLAATFLYAGIDLTTGALLSGARGQQIASRFSILEMTPFSLSDAADRRSWRGLIPAFERELLLHEHETGTLAELSDYLFARTGGSIGSLGRLITGSAIEAITNPNLPERIDKALLDSRKLDHTAETAHARSQARQNSTTRRVA
ncbi:TniB family NTP-binding protein [Cryobacterium sp. BB307]|uniref:TniB family NTP-binding protein n=1 Tax=Cryobacterium sp. BB307 TaxID=2716317 RepID=UPI001446EF4C|nr:TniB family NTP-binding protein [Cryobacterium sp. BB307]